MHDGINPVYCPECKRQIPQDADHCPYCAAPASLQARKGQRQRQLAEQDVPTGHEETSDSSEEATSQRPHTPPSGVRPTAMTRDEKVGCVAITVIVVLLGCVYFVNRAERKHTGVEHKPKAGPPQQAKVQPQRQRQTAGSLTPAALTAYCRQAIQIENQGWEGRALGDGIPDIVYLYLPPQVSVDSIEAIWGAPNLTLDDNLFAWNIWFDDKGLAQSWPNKPYGYCTHVVDVKVLPSGKLALWAVTFP